MPTQDEYTAAALDFESRATNLQQAASTMATLVDRSDISGEFARYFGEKVEQAHTVGQQVHDALLALADECRSRAEVCRIYTEKCQEYDALPDLEKEKSDPPQPSEPWVERG